MADSTHDMRRSVYECELKPKFGNQKLLEITHEDLRALTDAQPSWSAARRPPERAPHGYADRVRFWISCHCRIQTTIDVAISN